MEEERWVGAGGRRAFLLLAGNSLSRGRRAGRPAGEKGEACWHVGGEKRE